MAARRYQELQCWQLGTELKEGIFAFTARPHVARDFKFCIGIRDAGSSVTRNIVEGFERYLPGDFLRFLDFSRSSLGETREYLQDGLRLGYIDLAEFRALWRLAVRTGMATASLQAYLRRCSRSRGLPRAPRGHLR
jgi:four helix bundle protein